MCGVSGQAGAKLWLRLMTMRVLVANRGEIACRVLRALRCMGVFSVAVYTPEDVTSPHVWLADSAHALTDAKSYLDGAQLIAIAHKARATAIHPGYGFLSQSPEFAQAVDAAGLVFIGPSAQAMAALGDKGAARAQALACGIPVVPGERLHAGGSNAEAAAAAVGYPLLVKAAGGGGGRGMRRIAAPAQLIDGVAAAAREAQAFFGDGRLLLERYVQPARHIEVQILADGKHTVAVGERECSLQRRYQKVVEEGPAAHVSAPLRARLRAYAEALGERTGYSGAGTVEFLLGPHDELFFLEVNTRLQVEHPVTEMTTGLDLVEAQIELAHGGKVSHLQIWPTRGHAIEVRLNAEDAAQNFIPQTGTVLDVAWPTGANVRVDAGVAQGTVVGPHYDPLLAKIIAWGPSRSQALRTLTTAVDELLLLGVQHNQSFLAAVLRHPAMVSGETYTDTIEAESWPASVTPSYLQNTIVKASAECGGGHGAQGAVTTPDGPWALGDGFRGGA